MLAQRVFLITAAVLTAALALNGQTGSGTVQGVVRDATSAVIPGANVSIVHIATMGKYTTTTNEVGFFRFPPTQFGSYKITVSASGMQTWEAEFLLQVGQTVDVSPVLKVGEMATQVTVAGEAAPLVATSDAVISTNLERARIEQLPLNGRSIATLALISTPGLVSGQDGAVNPIINGLRDSVELYQDGAVIKNRDTGDFAGRLPGLDSVQETRVETSLSSAKFNRPASITLSTRSGTNKVHGTLFETARNSAIGVARRRQDYYEKAPHYVRNEFGGSVGGPVFLPKLYNGKNRTFFFTSYEQNRSASASTMSTSLVTMAMRQGDFSGLIDSLGRKLIIYDPWTTGPAPTWQRTPFPNNQIPVDRESPIAKYLFSVTPQPTNAANPMLASNYFGLAPTNTRDYMSTSRIDHRPGDRDQLFGRFTVTRNNQTYPRAVPTTDNTTSAVYNLYFDHNAAASWIHSFSPTFLSETLVTFSREHKFTGPVDVPGIPNLADYLGMPNPLHNPLVPFRVDGGNFGMEYAPQPARLSFTDILVIDQNFTRVRGRHEIQFGGRFHQEYLHAITDQSTSNIQFNNNGTALFDPSSGSAYSAVPQTGYGVASHFLGAASSYNYGATQPGFYLRDPEYSGYVQDNWKLSSALTLNLGLRYQNLPGMTTVGNLAVSFDKKTASIVLGRPLQDMYEHKVLNPVAIASYQAIGVRFVTPSQAGIPDSLVNRANWNFQPRIGFAYRIGRTQRPLMLRGGWGIYSSQIAMRIWSSASYEGGSAPYAYSISHSLDNQAFAGVIPGLDGLPSYSLRSVPMYVAGKNIEHILDDPALIRLTPGRQLTYKDPDQSPSTAQEWNVSFGREILTGIVATASYVGTHGNHLPQRYNFNAAPNDFVWYTATGLAKPTGTYASTAMRPYDKTTYGNITALIKKGYSNAHTAQLQLQRRFSNGYGFQFYYVLTNALTNSTVVANGGGPTILPPESYLPGTVPQDFDKMVRSLYYTRDTMIPRSQLRWNWVVDLPFGRGKPLGRNAGGFLNAVIGGWQIAGLGSYYSTYWSLPTNNWGATGKVEQYGKKYPIQNCTSGICIPGYLYWNGYISPPLVNRTNAAGNCTGICGLPANYAPAIVPLIPYGTTALPANAPSNTNISSYWDSNNVWIKLNNGSVVRTGYDTNLHPWMNQTAQAGPWRFNLDASAFKSVALTETVGLKFNADFFSVLNNPGLGSPGSNGILSTQNSANSARTLQLTLRLTW